MKTLYSGVYETIRLYLRSFFVFSAATPSCSCICNRDRTSSTEAIFFGEHFGQSDLSVIERRILCLRVRDRDHDHGLYPRNLFNEYCA